jgi:hypothetical protein
LMGTMSYAQFITLPVARLCPLVKHLKHSRNLQPLHRV